MAQTVIQSDTLWQVVECLPEDYQPWGEVDYDEATVRPGGACQCSCGCRHFITLDGPRGADWGVCANPASHRAGKLTFEHQGCLQFEYDPALDLDV